MEGKEPFIIGLSDKNKNVVNAVVEDTEMIVMSAKDTHTNRWKSEVMCTLKKTLIIEQF